MRATDNVCYLKILDKTPHSLGESVRGAFLFAQNNNQSYN